MGGRARLRVGIVGTGFIGAVHARSALLAGGQIAAVAASSEQSAQAAAERLGAERAFPSAEELVASDELDVVHVCTPNHLHVPLAQAALEAGTHVICEKPIALDDEGASQLVEQVAARGLQGAVPFVYRYYPMVREAREQLRGSRLRLLHGTYLQDWLSLPADDNWRVESHLGGASRAFADIGSHWCDLAEFASGHRIARLSARTATVVPERSDSGGRPAFARADASGAARPVDTEDVAIVQFETDGGALGSVVVSQVSPGRKNRLWIEWDTADESLAFDQESPELLWRGRRDGASLAFRDANLLTAPAARFATLPAGHPQGYADCFDAFVADVYEAIRTGTPPDGMPQFADGRRAVQLTEAVLASAAAGGAWTGVPVPDPDGGARVKLGFLTACMPERSLEQIATWAGAHGYDALELAAWPTVGERPFTASHVAADAFDEREADRVRAALAGNGLTLSALAYYDNNLHPDPVERGAIHAHVRACIDTAAALGGAPVGTFVGRDPGRSVAENLREAERVLPPLVAYANERGVKLMIENCVMEGWHPDGYPGNLAYSPELWEWMFELGLYLNFDPSHLLWLGIDPITALKPYVDRVVHAHAKDAETFPAQRDRYGFFGRTATREQSPWDMGWWRYRIPGLGQVDFARYVDTLYEGGFDGVLSVEHEDPVWGGTPEKVEQGLQIAHRTLRPLVVG